MSPVLADSSFSSDRMWMAELWSRPTSFLRDRRGFPVSSVDFLPSFWAAIADVRCWSPAFMRTFLRTCKPNLKRLLLVQRLRVKIAVCDLSHDSSIRYKLGDMYTTVYVYDFPSRASKARSCPREACAWEIRSCCPPRNFKFRRHCIRHLESGEIWA